MSHRNTVCEEVHRRSKQCKRAIVRDTFLHGEAICASFFPPPTLSVLPKLFLLHLLSLMLLS